MTSCIHLVQNNCLSEHVMPHMMETERDFFLSVLWNLYWMLFTWLLSYRFQLLLVEFWTRDYRAFYEQVLKSSIVTGKPLWRKMKEKRIELLQMTTRQQFVIWAPKRCENLWRRKCKQRCNVVYFYNLPSRCQWQLSYWTLLSSLAYLIWFHNSTSLWCIEKLSLLMISAFQFVQ